MSNTETYHDSLIGSHLVSQFYLSVVMKWFFWDNSPDGFNKGNTSESIQKLKGFGLTVKYFNSPENMPLSAIYNTSLDDYCHNKDYLMIFDQDSKFDGNYFIEFEKSIGRSQYDIVLPVIKYKNKIVSPTRVIYLKVLFQKSTTRKCFNLEFVRNK